jgi:hypothetical protein
MRRALQVLNAIVAGGRDLKCEACGKDFVCGVSLKGCWCAEIELSDEARQEMRSRFKDCLCRDCLEQRTTKLT